MRQDPGAKSALLKNYLFLFCGTLAATSVFFVIVATIQMSSVHELYVERIKKVIALHKNEMLNEIALEDSAALNQHLEIIRSELGVDSLSLKVMTDNYHSSDPNTYQFSLFAVARRILFRVIGVEPLKVTISNDFESVDAQLIIIYERNFFEWVLSPFLNVSVLILGFTCFPVGLIFLVLFRRIDMLLIQPLRKVTDSFTVRGGADISDITANAIGEIKSLAIASQKLRQAERSTALTIVAHQVSHDIRSPLAALEMVIKNLPEIPEQKRLLIRDALGRIRDIANNLLQQNRDHSTAAGTEPSTIGIEGVPIIATSRSTEFLSVLIDSLVSEKRMQLRSQPGIEIDYSLDPSSYGVFASTNSIEFKRMLSNLLNNSVDAIGEKGKVTIRLEESCRMAIINVSDTGIGITPEILSRLGKRGATHGKIDGSGLGLHHAREAIESWGGTFRIDSKPDKGTLVTIRLPLAEPPSWFVEKLKLNSNSKLVVLDDDTSIHHIWEGSLENQNGALHGIRIFHFSTPDQIREFLKKTSLPDTDTTFLVDYELIGFKESGLDLIEELQLQTRAILVTSRYEETSVRSRCEHLGVGLIPKGLAGFVPIEINSTQAVRDFPEVDAVLIDDDILVRQLWQMAANDAGKNILCFEDLDDFLKACSGISKTTCIYIDSSLRNGILGEVAAKDILAQGFKEIVLATGKEPQNLHMMPWIKKIVGKGPPF